MKLSKFTFLSLSLIIFLNEVQQAQCLVLRNWKDLKQRITKFKRDVTVIQTNGGDPCPTVVDSNRVVGAGFHFGPTVNGNFYGQGQRQNPLNGFKSWGGNTGYNDLGFKGGWDFGIPIGSKVLNGTNSGCTLTTYPQGQRQQFQAVQRDTVANSGPFQAGPGVSSIAANQYDGHVFG